MSLSLANVCPAILTSLSDNLINNPANVNINGGTLAALNDPSNLRSGQIIRNANDDGTGHSKQVRVVYKQRLLKSDTVIDKDCVVGDEMLYQEETFPIQNYRGIPFSMTEAQLRTYCASYSELVRLTGSTDPGQIVQRAGGIGSAQGALSVVREMFMDFQLAAEALVQGINSDLLTSIAGSFGTYVGGAATKPFIIQNADGSINADGLFDMKQEYMITGFNGAPIIIGGAGALQRVWMNDSRYFGQAANGINFSTVRDNTGIAQFYYDQNVNTVLSGQSKAVIFAPGSLVYTPFLQYAGNFGQIGTMQRFTMPIPGLPNVKCDVRILPNECDENYAVWMEAYFDVYAAPTTMFPAGDYLEGVNGVFAATFTQA